MISTESGEEGGDLSHYQERGHWESNKNPKTTDTVYEYLLQVGGGV